VAHFSLRKGGGGGGGWDEVSHVSLVLMLFRCTALTHLLWRSFSQTTLPWLPCTILVRYSHKINRCLLSGFNRAFHSKQLEEMSRIHRKE
jgi:hypothetical protein